MITEEQFQGFLAAAAECATELKEDLGLFCIYASLTQLNPHQVEAIMRIVNEARKDSAEEVIKSMKSAVAMNMPSSDIVEMLEAMQPA